MVPSENLLEEIKKNIFSLLLPEKNGMILRQLQREYLENFGQEIPFRKFGFVSLTNLFSDMKDKVYTRVVNGVTTVAAIPSAKSAHLSALVAGQKSSAKKPRRPMRRLYNPRPYYPPAPMQRIHIPIEVQGMLVDMVNQKPGYLTKTMALDCVQLSMPYVIVSMNDVNTLLQTMSHKIQLQNDRLYPCTPVRETSRQTQNAPVNGACSKADPVEVCAAGSESAVDVLNSDTDNDDFNFVPAGCDPSLMDKKKSLISKLASNLLNDATSKRCNELKDNRTENTIEEKRKEIDKSTVSPNQSRPQQWTDDINRLDKDVYVDSKTVSSLVNDRLKNKLEKLIEKYPDGIWCANLPEKFQEEYKVPLHYVELGFSSIREFASYLPEIFHCKAMDGFVDYMLYSAKLELPETTNNLTCKDARLPDSAVKQIDFPGAEREALPSVVSSEICRTLIPDTVLTIGESVPHLSIPNLTNLEEIYLEVVVVEIFTPSFFWIQLRSHQKLFKSFMDELGSFYTIADLTYNIPPVVLEEGLNCVCKYNDIWHRGIIEAVKPDLQVTVFFYDYGTLKTYPASELRYLHRSFAQLPAQAIPCGLVNTKPYGDAVKWPRTACRRFTMRVSQIPLIATIASTNKEDNSMMITLTDTSEEEDVHLNDWLVEQKLAEHGKMVDHVEMSKLMLYEEEKLIYPSELCYENELYDSHPKPVEDKTVQTIDKVLDVPLIQPKNTFSEKHLSPPPGFANPPNPFGPPSLAPQYSWSFLENAVKTTQEQFQIQPDQNMTWQQFVKASNKSLELQIEISQAFNTVLSKMLRNSQNAYPNYVANPQVPPTNINPQVLPGATANLNVNGNRNIYSKPKIRGVRRLNTNSVSNDSKSSIDQGTKGYPFQNPNIATSNNVKSDSFISLNPFRTATVNAADTSKDINVINGSYCGNTSNKINVTDSCTSTYSTSVSSGATNGLPMEQPKSPVDYSSLFKTNTPVCNNVIDENGVKNNINDNFTPLITSPKSKDVFVETNPFKLGLTGKSAIPEPNKKETQSLLGEYYKTPVTTNYSDALNRTTDVEQASYDLSSSNNQDLSVPSPAHYSFDGNHNAVGINLWSFKAKGHLNSDAGIEESALHNGTVKENITSVLKINSEKRQEYLSNNMTENHQRTQADLYDFSNKGSGLFSTFIDQNHFLRRTSISIDTTAAFVDGQISKVPVMEKERTQSPEEAQELHEFSNGYSESNNALVNKYSTGRKPMNPAAPEWTPTTGFATPLTIEKSPIDEGYQTGPTTTNTLPSSPPLLVELPFGKKNQVLKTKSIDSKKSDSDSRQIQKSPETTERKQSTQSPHPRPEVYKCGLDMFCRIVDLPNCPVHIFHYSGEGWILSEDFVDVFTDLKTVTYMISLLQILDLEIRFKEVAVTRLKLLDQSNSELNKNIEDDGESKDCKVHLTPLKSIIKVLIKLGVVTRDEIHRAIVKKDIIQGSAPHEMISMVIRAYGELLQVIEKRE